MKVVELAIITAAVAIISTKLVDFDRESKSKHTQRASIGIGQWLVQNNLLFGVSSLILLVD